MAASDKTIEDTLMIIMQHIDRQTLKEIVRELLEVEGNKSFKDTIRRMYRRLQEDE